MRVTQKHAMISKKKTTFGIQETLESAFNNDARSKKTSLNFIEVEPADDSIEDVGSEKSVSVHSEKSIEAKLSF